MLSNFEVTFGKQSIWWGTGDGGSLDLSNNTPPINMFRINRTTPLKLPSFLGWLGPMGRVFPRAAGGVRIYLQSLGLVGQWGQALPKQPFIHGQNISFKPTPNFEFGFYRTTIFGGEGIPSPMGWLRAYSNRKLAPVPLTSRGTERQHWISVIVSPPA